MADESLPQSQLSPVETIKAESNFLRGNIRAELTSGEDHVSKETQQLLKFHGTYQQDDRDARKRRDRSVVGKHYYFMVRCRIPGGKISAESYLAMDDIARRHANGTLRFTTRQGIQFHGVVRGDLQATIKAIHDGLLTTLGACGDVERNVTCCPAPGPSQGQIELLASEISERLSPRTSAYFETWLNGQKLPAPYAPDTRALADAEPIYGRTYLPRKFKTGITLPHDNCIDVYAQDLGLVANVVGGEIAGYDVLVGGGMGMSPAHADTFAALARPIAYVRAQDAARLVEAVVKLYRDHGNRADRKRARIKYLLADWGVAKFRDCLGRYFGGPLDDPRGLEVQALDPHHGWHPQPDGRWFYGLAVASGRVKDEGPFRLRTALRQLVQEWRPTLRLTPLQDVLLCDLPDSARGILERTLESNGVACSERLSPLRRLSMACPALPTCGLAITESERALPGIIDQLEQLLAELCLQKELLTVRMTGCPNGCARPYQSDVGIVGRGADKYAIHVGGGLKGDRLNFVFQDLVPRDRIVAVLEPAFRAFKWERRPGEGFGDFCARWGVERLRALTPSVPPPGAVAAARQVAG